MRNRLKSALNNLNEERGSVFPILLIMLLLGGILLLPQLVGLVNTNIVSGSMYQDKSHELYAADAGAMDALWVLANHTEEEMTALIILEDDGDPFKYIYELPDPIDNKTVHYWIMANIEDEGYIIQSTATSPDGSSTTVEVWCIHPEDHPTLKFSTGSLDGDLRISADLGTLEEPVNIYANGNSGIQGSAVVYGDAYYTPGHEFTVDGSATFTGESMQTRPLQVAEDYLPSMPETVHEGDMKITGTVELGDIHITGDLSLIGNAHVTLTGTVWVDGTISASTSNSIIDGEDEEGGFYFLVSDLQTEGTAINFQGGSVQAVLYTTGGSIYLAGNVDLNGAAVGYGDIDIMGTANLFNAVPLEQVPISFYPMSVLFWRIY